MAGSNTLAYPTHANTQECCCATHVCTIHTARETAVSTPLYTPAYTGNDGRDLYHRNAGGR